MVDINRFCDLGTRRVPRKPHFSERGIEDGVGFVEGSHEVVGHTLHRTVDHMVEEPRVPSNTSRTPHFCQGAGVHDPRGFTTDARVALLEAVFVLITLHQERASGVQLVTRASHAATRERCPTWGLRRMLEIVGPGRFG